MSRRGAFWGRKKKRSSSREKSATVTTGARTREALESYDYGLYYDSVNARGKCDDLVLLENLSNEEIVEVSYAVCVTHRVCCPNSNQLGEPVDTGVSRVGHLFIHSPKKTSCILISNGTLCRKDVFYWVFNRTTGSFPQPFYVDDEFQRDKIAYTSRS